jgi:nonribosomal peptide synthetase DhbF
VIVPDGVRKSFSDYRTLLAEKRVTVLNQTPSAFYQLTAVEQEMFETHEPLSLRYVIFGGEALDLAKMAKWPKSDRAADPLFVNMYGITEITVHATYIALPRDIASGFNSSVVGVAIPNTQIYILDASLQPVPVGTTGEMYIAGVGLARGYAGRADLTAERFIANPYGPSGARMYRTGDLARWREDGNIEYLGRADQQVKIRGFRIELGEIEAALLQIEGLSQVSVQAREIAGEKRLVAYVVGQAGGVMPQSGEMRAALLQSMPDYMVPANFVVLEALPLTTNGKLNARALPEPHVVGNELYRSPVTEFEKLIASLFMEITAASQIGLDDSFFAIGGHSLLAMRLISQIRARTGIDLALKIIFEQPTVLGIAQAIAEAKTRIPAGEVARSARPSIKPGQGASGQKRTLS